MPTMPLVPMVHPLSPIDFDHIVAGKVEWNVNACGMNYAGFTPRMLEGAKLHPISAVVSTKEEPRDPATDASYAVRAADRRPGYRAPGMGGTQRGNPARRHRRRRGNARSPFGQRHHGPPGHRASLRRSDRTRPTTATSSGAGGVLDATHTHRLGV